MDAGHRRRGGVRLRDYGLMANLLLESFDHYSDGLEAAKGGWHVNHGSNQIFTDVGRFGNGLGMRLDNTLEATFRNLTSSAQEVFIGFAYKSNIFSTDLTTKILEVGSSATDSPSHLRLSLGTCGQLYLIRGSSISSGLLESNPDYRLSCNVWHWIQCRFLIDNAAGEYDVYVDGNLVLSGTGVDTFDNGDAEVSWVLLGVLNTADNWQYFDDVYVNDSTGPAPFNGFLGEVSIETFLPVANGFQNDFTPVGAGSNFQTVDDDPSPDGNATYIESSTVGHIDSFAMENLSFAADTVYCVEALSKVSKSAAGPRTYRNRIRSSGTDGFGTARTFPAGYGTYRDLYLVDPNTAVAWTAAAVNAMEVGVEIVT